MPRCRICDTDVEHLSSDDDCCNKCVEKSWIDWERDPKDHFDVYDNDDPDVLGWYGSIDDKD